MIASAHVLSGVLSGVIAARARTTASRAAVAFGLGVLFHVVIDAVPHSDYGSLMGWTRVAIVLPEVVASLAIGWFILRPQWRPEQGIAVLAGLAGAMLPDVKFVFAFFPEPVASTVTFWGDRFHSYFHASPTPFMVGKRNEAIGVAILIVLLTLAVRQGAKRRAQDSNL